jgi:hypothetical protein
MKMCVYLSSISASYLNHLIDRDYCFQYLHTTYTRSCLKPHDHHTHSKVANIRDTDDVNLLLRTARLVRGPLTSRH